MLLHLGLTESSLPDQTRVFAAIDGKFVDLNLAYARYLNQTDEAPTSYEQASFHFPATIASLLAHQTPSLKALEEVVSFARKCGVGELRGPNGEKVAYEPSEIRLMPPLQNPERSFVIGFSDQARVEALPKAEIPTGFYKLPQTFVTNGASIIWPKFSEEVDADACLALIIGKAGKRIPPERAWDHIAGVTLLIDITARDINRREGLTTNNLLGKNFPSSTCLGPAVLVKPARKDLESMEVELTVDGAVKQAFRPSDCVFTIEQIIARWSILGIRPGDFLAIGASMALKGDRLQNPVALKVGSQIRCSSRAIGELTHQVVAAGGLRR